MSYWKFSNFFQSVKLAAMRIFLEKLQTLLLGFWIVESQCKEEEVSQIFIQKRFFI